MKRLATALLAVTALAVFAGSADARDWRHGTPVYTSPYTYSSYYYAPVVTYPVEVTYQTPVRSYYYDPGTTWVAPSTSYYIDNSAYVPYRSSYYYGNGTYYSYPQNGVYINAPYFRGRFVR